MCCKHLLVLSGPTYFERLWCCFELYVYSRAHPHMDSILLWSLENASIQSVWRATQSFKMCSVKCFLESDKTAIVAAIETSSGGVEQFEKSIRELGKHVCNKLATTLFD